MSSGGSVTGWIQQMKEGEESALARLHARYWPALVAMAQKRLGNVPGRVIDKEDVAQEAFWSFYKSFKAGRLPRLMNRHDLLALLSHIIACKAVNEIEREFGAQKRGAGRSYEEAASDKLAEHASAGVALIQDDRGTPLEQAMLKDCYQYYIGSLPESLRGFAEHYVAGYTYREIAQHLGCVPRTVDRKIALILAKWRELAAASVSREC